MQQSNYSQIVVAENVSIQICFSRTCANLSFVLGIVDFLLRKPKDTLLRQSEKIQLD